MKSLVVCKVGYQGFASVLGCPLIEESEALQLQTAVESCEQLTQALPEFKAGLVHGRLKAEEKAAVMAAFKANEIQLLVATTVIEVGVDVPNAALMVIEHAERFGYAQIHQLRGRVGRGSADSVCILMYTEPLSMAAKERLQTLRETSDGFVIAERDLSFVVRVSYSAPSSRAMPCCVLLISNVIPG